MFLFTSVAFVIFQPPPKKKARNFVERWETDSDFKNWLVRTTIQDSSQKVFCKICQTTLKVSSGRSDLLNHANTQKHQTLSNAIKGVPSIKDKLGESTTSMNATMNLELQLSAFIAEHNIAFRSADHLSNLIKSISDSKIAKSVNCGRTKATSIVKNVFGAEQFGNVCNILREKKFSICIDESTDLSKSKKLSVVARVCLDFKVKDFFFGLIDVDECDATSLYLNIVKYFVDNKIDYKKNLIGFAADGANTMTGSNHSVAQLLKKDCPNLIILKCICHSMALCSSYACQKLPSSVESMVRDIYNYIANSPKRTNQFEKISALLEYKPKKMLHPSQTRWLSLELVVIRILELYEPLKIFFAFAYNIDQIDSVQNIIEKLDNPINELYLLFLKYILPIINNLNKLFQSENPQIQNMHSNMTRLFLSILDNFVQPQYLNYEDISTIDYKNTANQLQKCEIYLGTYVKDKLSGCEINGNKLDEFVGNCTAFYIELCDQILKRFDFSDITLKSLGLIDPRKVMNKEVSSLNELIQLFPNLVLKENIQKIDSEFRELRFLDFQNYFDRNEGVTVEDFWKTVSKVKRNDDSLAFPNVCEFISNLLSLPNSSANVERIFSNVNINKTKIRNRLETDTLKGIIFTQDYMKYNNYTCYNFLPKSSLLKKFNSNMYSFEKERNDEKKKN